MENPKLVAFKYSDIELVMSVAKIALEPSSSFILSTLSHATVPTAESLATVPGSSGPSEKLISISMFSVIVIVSETS